ncbi:hypothetical protein V5O48_013218 [Marasmius crinis-equi]|uniref:Uncharacterized protein n=1 Tax=Marasmius crinis-equi TaxID=585013 RepID=A0ABR3F115_9AGAR
MILPLPDSSPELTPIVGTAEDLFPPPRYSESQATWHSSHINASDPADVLAAVGLGLANPGPSQVDWVDPCIFAPGPHQPISPSMPSAASAATVYPDGLLPLAAPEAHFYTHICLGNSFLGSEVIYVHVVVNSSPNSTTVESNEILIPPQCLERFVPEGGQDSSALLRVSFSNLIAAIRTHLQTRSEELPALSSALRRHPNGTFRTTSYLVGHQHLGLADIESFPPVGYVTNGQTQSCGHVFPLDRYHPSTLLFIHSHRSPFPRFLHNDRHFLITYTPFPQPRLHEPGWSSQLAQSVPIIRTAIGGPLDANRSFDTNQPFDVNHICIRRADPASGTPALVRIAVDPRDPNWHGALAVWGLDISRLRYVKHSDRTLTAQLNRWQGLWWFLSLLGAPALGDSDVKDISRARSVILSNGREMLYQDVALEALRWKSVSTIIGKDLAWAWADRVSRGTWDPRFSKTDHSEEI